jgi:hypothetical protein
MALMLWLIWEEEFVDDDPHAICGGGGRRGL